MNPRAEVVKQSRLVLWAFLFAAGALVAVVGYVGWVAQQSATKLSGVTTAGPCRHALSEELPPSIDIGTAVNNLVAHPHSPQSTAIRGAVNRAVKNQECEDQAFLVCSSIDSVDDCIGLLSKAQHTREVDAGSGTSTPHGQPGGNRAPAPSQTAPPTPSPDGSTGQGGGGTTTGGAIPGTPLDPITGQAHSTVCSVTGSLGAGCPQLP